MTTEYIEALAIKASSSPDQPFLVEGDSVISYGELWSWVTSGGKRTDFKAHHDAVNEIVSNWLLPQINITTARNKKSDLAEIVSSSGSSGTPKHFRVPFRAQLITSTAINSVILNGQPYDELILLPLAHSNARGRFKAALLRGATVFAPFPGNSISSLINTLGKSQNLAVSLTPPTFRLLKSRLKERFWSRLSGVKHIEFGSAPFFEKEYLDLIETAPESIGLRAHFGMTEASRSFVKDIRQSDCFDIGTPMPHVNFEIDSSGQLILRGPHLASHVKKDGADWQELSHVLTGDLVNEGATGRLQFVGKNSNSINSGGLKLQPEWVESRIQQLSGVEFLHVVGLPDDLLGERVVLVCPIGHAENVVKAYQELNEFETLPVAKAQELSDIPYLPSGKVDRIKLKGKIARIS